MPDLALDDLTLHYEVAGSGPPLVLLAGIFGDCASWAALLPLLTPHFTVICPDNRGTGRSAPTDAPATVQTYASDAATLMEHLGFESYHVAGHSMGGLAGMELAQHHPTKVRTLSVLASAPVRIPRGMAVFDALCLIRAAPEGERLWLRALYPWLFGPAFFRDPANLEEALAAALSYPHAQSVDAMAQQIEVLRAYRPTVRPSDITCPALVLYAEDDLLIPEAEARESFSAMQDVRQFTLSAAGHAIHWDAAEAVAAHLQRFAGAHPIEGKLRRLISMD